MNESVNQITLVTLYQVSTISTKNFLCGNMNIKLSHSSLTFGSVGPGGAGHHNLTFHLINEDTTEKVFFQCMFRGMAGSFFTVDDFEGVLPPKSRFPLKVTLNIPGSSIPCNVHDKLVILTTTSTIPLSLDLLASVHFDYDIRPPLLAPCHISNSSDTRSDLQKALDDISFISPKCPLQIVSQDSGLIDYGKVSGKVIIDQTLKVHEVILRNSGDLPLLINFSTDHLQLDEYIAVALNTDFAEIAPRAELVIEAKLVKTADVFAQKVLLGRIDATVCYKEDGHFMTADTPSLAVPWMLKLLITADLQQNHVPEPNVTVKDKVVKLAPTQPGCRVSRVVEMVNNEIYTVPFRTSLDSPGNSFSVAPPVGLIKPKSSGLFLVSFESAEAVNQISREILSLSLNGDVIKIPLVATVCARPELEFPELLVLPPVSAGSTASRNFQVDNLSELAVELSLAVESPFLTFDPPATVIPSKSSCNFQVTAIPGLGEGQHLHEVKLLARFANTGVTEEMTASILSVVESCNFEVSETEIDFGEIWTNSTHHAFFTIRNTATVLGKYSLHVTPSSDDAIKLESSVGELIGTGVHTINFQVRPPQSGTRQYSIVLTCDGEAVNEVKVKFTAKTPAVQIVAVGGSAPPADIWLDCGAFSVNDYLGQEPSTAELAFQATSSSIRKRSLWSSLEQKRVFEFKFPGRKESSHRSVITLTLKNTSPVDAVMNLIFPTDLTVVDAPRWATEVSEDTGEGSHHEWCIANGLFSFEPKSACIKPGSTVAVTLSYAHKFPGRQQLPLILELMGGRVLPILLSGFTERGSVPVLSCPEIFHLPAVPINAELPVISSMKLNNNGGLLADWEVASDSLIELNTTIGYGAQILDLQPRSGTIASGDCQYVEFAFQPREVREYSCNFQIKCKYTDSTVTFTVVGRGYDPREGSEQSQPSLLPLGFPAKNQSGYLAGNNQAVIDFGASEVGSVPRMRIISLENRDRLRKVSFNWDSVSSDVLDIDPVSGFIFPGEACLVTVLLSPSYPMILSTDLTCSMNWVTESEEISRSLEAENSEPSVEEEVFAFHSSYPQHRLAYSAKNPLKPLHTSVTSRLTISRLRSLLATPGGQKYLADNLHTSNAQLSSSLPKELKPKAVRDMLSLPCEAPEDVEALISTSYVRVVAIVTNSDKVADANIVQYDRLVQFGSGADSDDVLTSLMEVSDPVIDYKPKSVPLHPSFVGDSVAEDLEIVTREESRIAKFAGDRVARDSAVAALRQKLTLKL